MLGHDKLWRRCLQGIGEGFDSPRRDVASRVGGGDIALALTERERKILQLNAEGLSDYQIAKKLKIETPNVYRARKVSLKKLDRAREDLSFADSLEL